MASRHSTGITYSLARNSCLNTRMRVECIICSRGAEFPRASARCCLTLLHGVFSAHRFSSRSFSSPTQCTGFTDSPPPRFDNGNIWPPQGELPTRLAFASWLVCPQCSPLHCARYELFIELCNMFVYCRANYFFSSSDSCFWIHHVSCRVGVISLNSEMIFFITEQTTSTQVRTRFSRMWVGTLNQSISRDGSSINSVKIIIFQNFYIVI